MSNRPKSTLLVVISYCLGLVVCALIGMIITYFSFKNGERDAALATVFYSIFAAILSTSITIVLFEVVLRRATQKKETEVTQTTIDDSVRRAFRLKKSGIANVYSRFQKNKFNKAAKQSNSINILQTYVPNLDDIEEAITSVLARGGKVRIALVKPDSDFAKIRFGETSKNHKSLKYFNERIKDCEGRLKKIVTKTKTGNAEIKYYDRSPGLCIYGIENMMIVSSFLTNTDAENAPQLEISSKTNAYEVFLAHFEEIWKSC